MRHCAHHDEDVATGKNTKVISGMSAPRFRFASPIFAGLSFLLRFRLLA